MNNGLPGPSTTDTITGGKTQELSAYDRVRKPHRRVIDASTMVAIGPRTLSAELTCPICLDLLTNTMTTKECLHRFCEECIKNALMRGNKECPTCRNKIVSKRSLRHDTNFDALISKIWPDRREYERMQEASLRIFQEQSNIGALQQSIEAGMKAQAATRRMRVQGSYDYEKRKRRVGPTATNGAGASGIAALTVDGADEGGGARDDDAELAISEPSDSDGSSDSSDTSSESRMSDERSAASALSSASEARMAVIDAPAASRAPKASARRQPVVKPPSTSSSLNDKMSKWMKDNAKCNSPAVDDGLDDASSSSSSKNFDPRLLEMRRKGELIDILLAPAKSMLCRANSNGEANSALPLEMLKPLFVRLPPDITVEHVGDYLYQMALKHSAGNSPLSVESAKPSYFYILNHNNQVRKIFLHEALYSAFITAQLTDNYVRLFYDTQPPDVHSAGRLVTEIVSDELATQTA